MDAPAKHATLDGPFQSTRVGIMKIAVLVLLAALHLQAATILPGSWIEWSTSSGAQYNIKTDDGFQIAGAVAILIDTDPSTLNVDLDWSAFHGDVQVDSVSPPWLPGNGFAADGDVAVFVMSAPETHYSDGSAPFTFAASIESAGAPAGSPVFPLIYEFSGQGTAYLTIDQSGEWPFASSVRYEFEAVEVVPEPSTWGLLLLGLVAACWAGKKPRQRTSRGDAEYAPNQLPPT